MPVPVAVFVNIIRCNMATLKEKTRQLMFIVSIISNFKYTVCLLTSYNYILRNNQHRQIDNRWVGSPPDFPLFNQDATRFLSCRVLPSIYYVLYIHIWWSWSGAGDPSVQIWFCMPWLYTTLGGCHYRSAKVYLYHLDRFRAEFHPLRVFYCCL